MGKGETTNLTTMPPFGKQKKSFQQPTQCVLKTRKKKKKDSLKNSATPGASVIAQSVKNLPAMQEARV